MTDAKTTTKPNTRQQQITKPAGMLNGNQTVASSGESTSQPAVTTEPRLPSNCLSESPALAEQFLALRLTRLAYGRLGWVCRLNLLFGGVAAGFVYGHVAETWVVAWLCGLVACWLTGECSIVLYNKRAAADKQAALWIQLCIVVAAAIGLTWGLAAVVAILYVPPIVQLSVFAALLTAVVTGALGLIPVAASAYTLLALVFGPWIGIVLSTAELVSCLHAALIAALCCALVWAVYQGNRIFAGAITAREDLRCAQKELTDNHAAQKSIRERLQFEIKDRKAVEADLTKAKHAAEQAARVKTDFLATMSHEIRTPMNGVLGMTELLLNTELNKKQKRFAETIHRSGASLLTIINDILDFSKIEAGKLELNPVTFNLRQLAEDTVGLFGERADRKGIALGFVYQAGAHETFRGDGERIRQILNNLIGNAVKFTERGQVVLRISVVHEVATGCRLRFEVTDTGIGIKPEAHGKIFDSFAQADNSTTRKYGGTGLGLAICKQLVQMMAGEIGLQSQFGKGSTFWIELPLPKVVGVRARGGALAHDSLSDVRVLIADDNQAGREMLGSQLVLWGAKYHFTSRDEALQELRNGVATKQAYDVLILDESSSSKLALKMTESISQYPELANLRVILLLSARNLEETAQLMMMGVDGYVDKPVRQAELYSCLIKVLGLSDQLSSTRTSVRDGAPPETEVMLRGNVLVAEDNPVNQELVSRMLEALGCRVHVVSNGREAVDALWKTPLDRLSDPYELILMDCQMPEMDGFEATAKIRSVEQKRGDNKRVPIVALTANAMAGDRETCLAAGMDDYLSKPFTLGQLGEVMRRWLKSVEPTVVDEDDAVNVDPVESITAAAPPVASENPVNLSALDKIRALQREGQPDVVVKIVSMFLDSSVKLLQGLEEAVMVSDAEKLRHNAHSLKSSSANLGAEQLATYCRELEEMGRERRLNSAFAVLTRLQVEYKAACEALSNEIRKRAA